MFFFLIFNFFVYFFFLCTKGTLRSGRVEDNKIMFTRHLQLPQSYIQAILNIDKTDCMISLITMHILNARCICWQQQLRLFERQKKNWKLKPLVNTPWLAILMITVC